MRFRDPVQTTVIACAAMALAAGVVALVLGHPRTGLALAAGLLLGSMNGVLILRSLRSGASFQATSLGRLAILSVAAIAIGLLVDHDVIWPVLGLAAAQITLAGAAGYTLTRR